MRRVVKCMMMWVVRCVVCGELVGRWVVRCVAG